MTLPDNWTMCRLEDLLAPNANAIADGPFGSALKSTDYTEDGCRVIRLNNVGVGIFIDTNKAFIDMHRFPALRRHEARAGDLVTAALGDPLGRTCQIPDEIGPAIVKADCFRTRLHERISAELIMYWLNSPSLSRYFNEHSKGIGRIRITLSTLRQALLPLPPESEQRALAVKLRALVRRARSAKTEAKQALRASQSLKMSGLRAGVTGRLTARWRDTTSRLETAEELLSRTPAPEQGRGGRKATDRKIAGMAGIAVNNPETELPLGWCWTPLLRVARQETGHTPSRQHPEYWDGDIDWLGIKDARKHHGTVINSTAQTITKMGLEASSARLLPAQTVCLSRTASVGYVTMLGREMATSQDFVTWTCSPALLPEYLMYALMAEGNGLRRFGRGSTHTTIYFPELRAFHIALPPVEEQLVIIARVRRLLHHADVLSDEANRAADVANELTEKAITHAMSGGFRIVTAEEPPAHDLLISIASDREKAVEVEMKMRKTKKTRNVEAPKVAETEQAIFTETVTLTQTVINAGGSLRADVLWRRSGLSIDEFYRYLREEVAAGRIRESTDKENLLAS